MICVVTGSPTSPTVRSNTIYGPPYISTASIAKFGNIGTYIIQISILLFTQVHKAERVQALREGSAEELFVPIFSGRMPVLDVEIAVVQSHSIVARITVR
jgi:hypothetical protein